MNWIAHLSLARALLISGAWPVTLTLLPAVALGIGRIYAKWIDWRSEGSETYVIRFRILNWRLLLIVLVVPPLVFLVAWWLGQPSVRSA